MFYSSGFNIFLVYLLLYYLISPLLEFLHIGEVFLRLGPGKLLYKLTLANSGTPIYDYFYLINSPPCVY